MTFARITRSRAAAAAAAAAVCALCAVRGYAESLTYTLEPLPKEGRLRVTLSWQTQGREASRLCVSRQWGTAADVPSMLHDVRFENVSRVQRDEACWDVWHKAGAEVRCSYTVDSGRRTIDWQTTQHPITTERFFHGVGTTFLLSPAPGGAMPAEYEVLVRWQLPRAWKAACSWGAGRTVGARLSPDDLRRSVYVAGDLVLHHVEVPGADELTVAMIDAFNFGIEAFAKRAGAIIASQTAFMRETQFPPFVITVVPVGAQEAADVQRMFGTGLHRSFALWLPPGAQQSDGVEHLLAHELFHYWNGGVLRAEQRERLVYWFIEGFTDYFALRVLHDAGCWTPETYAKWINRHLQAYDANPAQNAPNEAIDAQYASARQTVGEVAYQRGLLLGLRWHKLARDRGVPGGIDAWMMALLGRARAGRFEVTNASLRETGVRALGPWFEEEFDRYVMRAETVDVPPDALAPHFNGATRAVYAFELGFDRETSLREKRVHGLLRGSEAAKAGLRDGDELAGWAIHGDPDRKIRLQVQRDGKRQTVEYFPRGARRDVLQFEPARRGR